MGKKTNKETNNKNIVETYHSYTWSFLKKKITECKKKHNIHNV